MKYRYHDIATDEYGEVLLSADSTDMQKIANFSATKQIIEHRFKTIQGDLYCHQSLGLGIQELVGKRMSLTLIAWGRSNIIKALAYDDFIAAADISVTSIPTSVDTVLYHVYVDLGERQTYTADFIFDTNKGLRKV